MKNDDPGFMPPYLWRRQPSFGLVPETHGRHAVVLSWHVAPDFATMPGQDRMLAIWAEPLLDVLVEAGFRTTLLIVGAEGDAAASGLGISLRQRGIGLALVAGHDPLARASAVDAVLAGLAPDVVHAPERLGLLAAALSRRAAGLEHLDTEMVLHARGPTLFQMEEQGRFIGDVTALLLDDLERQAMRLADRVVCCNPEVARYLAEGFGDARASVACEMVAPLAWPLPPVAEAVPNELVFPLPLCSEAGLEFAVAALARASARKPFPLPVTFLGQPDAVTIGTAASVLAGLAPPPALPGAARPAPRLEWQVLIAETPQRAMQYLAQPGRVALLTSARATPPEMLAMCGAAGIPVLATANAATLEAAARWPCIRALPRAERGFGAMLGRLPVLPVGTPTAEAPAPAPIPVLFDGAPLVSRALASMAAPEAPELTVVADARPSLMAQLTAQTLPAFGISLVLPPGVRPPPAAAKGRRPVRLVPGGPGALRAELARCETRYAVLCGDAGRLAPHALGALLQAARNSQAPAIAAWDNHGHPVGGGPDLALLRPGNTIGHLVLLDLPALRQRGSAWLDAVGTPDFAAALAQDSGGVMMLAAELAEAPTPPALAAEPSDALLPPRLRGAAALALHFSAQAPSDPMPAHANDIQRAMADANRESTHYLKLIGRLLDGLGLEAAAGDAWRALLARDAEDGETWLRVAQRELALSGSLPHAEQLAAFVKTHGVGPLGDLPELTAQHAHDLLQAGKPEQAMRLLHEAAPVLQGANGYIQALARVHARLSRSGRPLPLPTLSAAPYAALRAALEAYAISLPPPEDEEAA